MKWPLARVMEKHNGPDGLTRVVTLKCNEKLIKRPITKVCLLPQPEKEQTNYENAILQSEQSDKEQTNSQPLSKEPETNNIQSSERITRSKSKTKSSFKASIFSFICAFLSVINQSTQGFPIAAINNAIEIHYLDSNSGMYFEDLGKLNILTSEWNIITYYDLSNYWIEEKNIQLCIRQLQKLCETSLNDNDIVDLCSSVIILLSHRLKNIQHKNDYIFDRTENRRRRRGLVNVIGNIAHELFGVMDNKDAQSIDNHFKEIKLQADYHLDLLKNQTSIVETTVNIMKHQSSETIKHIQTLDERISRMSNSAVKSIHNNSVVQMIISKITLLIEYYEATQEALYGVLTDLQHGNLHPLLLTHEQLKQQLQLIRQHISPTSKLVTNNMRTLMKLTSVLIKLNKDKVIFKLKIPIVDVDQFNLFYMVPIPSTHNNRILKIIPKKEFIAINKHKDKYFLLTPVELSLCTRVELQNIVCKQPIIERINDFKENCELALMNHKTINASKCKIEETQFRQIWIPLKSPNRFLFHSTDPSMINIVCNEQSFSQSVQGTGIAHVMNECSIMDETSILTTIGGHNQLINSSFISLSNISKVFQNFSFEQHGLEYNKKNWNINSEDFENVQKSIQQLKNDESRTPILTNHDIHHYIMLYLIFIIIIIIITVLALKKKRLKVNSQQARKEPEQVRKVAVKLRKNPAPPLEESLI